MMGFQARVNEWLIACFGIDIARDPVERNHRFLEEALELVQACGCTASEAHQLVDYTFGRPVGERGQEVGGVMNTVAALCLAHGLDMADEGDREIARCWAKIERIREKQRNKPKHSPLPMTAPTDALIERLRAATKIRGLAPVDVKNDDPRTVGRIASPLCDEIARLRQLAGEAAARIEHLEARIEAAKKVLEFYAIPENWHGVYMTGSGPMADDWDDDYDDDQYPDGKPGKAARDYLRAAAQWQAGREGEG